MLRSPLDSFFTAFTRARAGNIAMIVALAVPVLLGVSALAIDTVGGVTTRSSLQQAADGAALAAARELPLRSTTQSTIHTVADTYARQNVAPGTEITELTSSILEDRQGVRVVMAAHVDLIFGSLFHADGYTPRVTSIARLAGGAPLCALALESAQPNAVVLDRQAHVIAPNCAVVSNSTNPAGMSVTNSAQIRATTICSAGGAAGGSSGYEPDAVTDCPAIPDPLAGRPEPSSGGCNHLAVVQVLGSVNLRPGVYCGGIIVLPGATANLAPGVYVIKSGPLTVLGNGALVGQYVGFYFVGDLSVMNFSANSRIDLSAPRDGDMAGFLFFANRVLLTGSLNLRHFRISSNNARNLLGTIYLRDGQLDVDADRPIADRSAYTVVVARRINVTAGPDLYLNTDYDGTDVPVPDGVGPRQTRAYLAQ